MPSHPSPVTAPRTIALIGAKGMLASRVRKNLPEGYKLIPFSSADCDITNPEQVKKVLSDASPDIILNCAAFTNVDGCESQQDLAMPVNGEGPGNLAEAALRLGATLVHVSTDFVFDGQQKTPYQETDSTNPLSEYGKSKLAGEQAILSSGLDKYFIIRTSWLYGPGGNNFVETIIRLAKERTELRIVADQLGTPTYTGDLADAIFCLLNLTRHQSQVTDPYGIYHFSNLGQCSWHEFAQQIVQLAQGQGIPLKVQKVRAIPTENYPLPAPRPAYSVFSKQKYLHATGCNIPDWRESLQSYFEERTLDTDQI